MLIFGASWAGERETYCKHRKFTDAWSEVSCPRFSYLGASLQFEPKYLKTLLLMINSTVGSHSLYIIYLPSESFHHTIQHRLRYLQGAPSPRLLFGHHFHQWYSLFFFRNEVERDCSLPLFGEPFWWIFFPRSVSLAHPPLDIVSARFPITRVGKKNIGFLNVSFRVSEGLA